MNNADWRSSEFSRMIHDCLSRVSFFPTLSRYGGYRDGQSSCRTISYQHVLYLLAGCGGGSGGSNNNGAIALVNIQTVSFVPKNTTITVGMSVQWTNIDSASHQVTSGTLGKTSNPTTVGPILINNNSTFTPILTQANFGDTITWRNDQTGSFALVIQDEANNVVATLNFLPGQIVSFTNFPTAGQYLFTQQNNPNFRGMLTLFGVPHPDGQFQSQVLGTGGTFTRPFPIAGTSPYYDLNPTNPNQSFMTGRLSRSSPTFPRPPCSFAQSAIQYDHAPISAGIFALRA